MSEKAWSDNGIFQVHPIGYIRRSNGAIRLEILEPFRPAMEQLDQFSHVIVVWWSNLLDDEEYRNVMQCEPPYSDGRVTGIFACRSPVRPNPILITTCKMEAVDEEQGIIQVANIDAYDGTPILDLKAYFPVTDRVKDATIPAWLSDWPEWMPDEGLGLEE